jgi:hypothetical protein
MGCWGVWLLRHDVLVGGATNIIILPSKNENLEGVRFRGIRHQAPALVNHYFLNS